MTVVGTPYVTSLCYMVPVLMTTLILTYSLTYCSVDSAYATANSLGPSALMSKIDLKNVFHLIPSDPMIGTCLECNGGESNHCFITANALSVNCSPDC